MQPIKENYSISAKLYQRALKSLPGGVNSPVRAFKSVGGTPKFIHRAKGAHLFDVDNNCYLDYVGSFGPMVLGHAHPAVIQAVQTVSQYGLSFGAPTELEIKLAELIIQRMPNIEQVRMVNSGTEATMTAIRIARAASKRDKIIKFTGGYHGHADSFLVAAGSGAATLGAPSSPGVTEATTSNTITANYNDLAEVSAIFDTFKGEIAAIIVEPIAGNMNMILPQPGFLSGLREMADQHGSLLIFDEVMTGFRVAAGGAQALHNVKPDLTTLGKIIGGGMPVGAIGGRTELMQLLSPVGSVYQAGTLSGNPVAMAAGICTLSHLNNDSYTTLDERCNQLTQGLEHAAAEHNIPLTTNNVGGMFGFAFCETKLINYQDIAAADQALFQYFFNAMLAEGHYFAPSAFEAGFVSLAHTEEDIAATISSAHKIFANMRTQI
jgi:glutamate-1-semialdehyde 2,1-aminomutase